jgi:hypothetical protein
LNIDRVKAAAGKYGKVSKKGLYAGIGLGRPVGGYAGLKAGEYAVPDSEVIQVLPQIDPGNFGPEEQAVYAALVGGYLAGGMGVAKAVTKYQELKDKDLEYTRPFLTPFTGLRKVRDFLDGEKEDLEDFKVEGEFFEDDK